MSILECVISISVSFSRITTHKSRSGLKPRSLLPTKLPEFHNRPTERNSLLTEECYSVRSRLYCTPSCYKYVLVISLTTIAMTVKECIQLVSRFGQVKVSPHNNL
ncbi:hypothetical protein Trydic_g22156 [Trypoxylus dichotomus]